MNYKILPEDFAYIKDKMNEIIGRAPDPYAEVNYALRRICERLFTEEELAISRKLYTGFYFNVNIHLMYLDGELSFIEYPDKKEKGTYVHTRVPAYFPCIKCSTSSKLLVKRLNEYIMDNKGHEDVRKLYEFMQETLEYRIREFDYGVRPGIRMVFDLPHKIYEALGEGFISQLEQRDKDFYMRFLYLAGSPSVRPLKFDKDMSFTTHEQLAIHDELEKFLYEVTGEKPSDAEAGEWIRKTAEKAFTKEERKFLGVNGTCSGISVDVQFKFAEVDGNVQFVKLSHDYTYSIRQNVFDIIDSGSELYGDVWKDPSEYLIKFLNNRLEEDGDVVCKYYYDRRNWDQERGNLLSRLNIVYGLERHGDITKELATLLAYLYKRKSASKEFKKVIDTMRKTK